MDFVVVEPWRGEELKEGLEGREGRVWEAARREAMVRRWKGKSVVRWTPRRRSSVFELNPITRQQHPLLAT
jgi:sugar lactone lactonase YvrE